MILETLYKRTKTGAIQYWKVSTFHDTIFKESGQLGTKSPIRHEEICGSKNVGKANETSPAEQADLQAKADWTKKHDEGYKTLRDLGIIMVSPTPEYVAKNGGNSILSHYHERLSELLDEALPKFNTDANGQVKPMLATDWKKVKDVRYPCYVQPKLDGVRCLLVIKQTNKGDTYISFLSRSGKEYSTLDHIAVDVAKYFNRLDFFDDVILDGEIYSDELTFQEITQAVKKQYPNSLKLHFRAYDVVSGSDQDIRLHNMQRMVNQIGSEFIHVVRTLVASNRDSVLQYHDEWVSEGYEGAMIRHISGSYGQGQRSRDLLKVKEFDETEYAFLRFEFGQRGVEDLIAVCITEDGQEFRAKMQGNKKWKEELYANMDNLEGSSITIKHFKLTDDGLPRFPIGKGFRNYE